MTTKERTVRNTITESGFVTESANVESAAGVVRAVKILGRTSTNNREYTDAAVRAAVPLYEGARVNVNHPRDPKQARDYRDRFGTLKGVAYRDGGLYGDLHYNPKHPIAEQFAWDAANSPASVGLSHVVDVDITRRGGKMIVENISRVRSVDVVGEPATNKTLFEGDGMDGEYTATTGDLTWDSFCDKSKEIFNGDGAPADKAKRISNLAKALLKIKDEVAAAVSSGGSETPAETPASDEAATEAVNPAAELDRLRAENVRLAAEGKARVLLAEADVEADDLRIKALVAMESDDDRTKLVATWPKRTRQDQPKGSGQRARTVAMESAGSKAESFDAKSYARALTR